MNKVFDDHRILLVIMLGWLALVVGVFAEMGLFKSDFVHFGPSEDTVYVGIVLNTWHKWTAVAVFSALSSFFNDFANEALEPLFICVLRDPKQRYIPYQKWVCLLITQGFTVYASIMSLFALYTYFSQLDFVVIKMLVGLLVNQYSTRRYLRNKQYEPIKFAKYYQHEDSDVPEMHDPDSSAHGMSDCNESKSSAGVFQNTVASVVAKHSGPSPEFTILSPRASSQDA